MKTQFLIFGAGGHGRSLHHVIGDIQSGNAVHAFVESNHYFDNPAAERVIMGTQVIPEQLAMKKRELAAVIGIGQMRSPESRRRLLTELMDLGFRLPPIISPHSTVSKHAILSSGAQIMTHAMVGPQVEIGRATIVNSGAQVEHGALVGELCHISTGALVNGDVVIGDEVFVGSGAIIREGVRIASGSFIPMGGVVTEDVK